jgi:DNA double-strand break repair helicase HerA and related ATPase
MTEPLLIAKAKDPLYLLPKMANRHGLIAGATGTGKTVTLQVMAERFSAIGVPVFMADVKGDLAGISQKGGGNAKVEERIKQLKPDGFTYQGSPVTFWDVFGEQGHPVRATISEMGPLLLGRLLNLNETQEGVLNLIFRIADDNGWLLLDLKDLRAMAATTPRISPPPTVTSPAPRSAPSNARCSRWKVRVPTNFSASRRSISTT